jgi:hypothetical protein
VAKGGAKKANQMLETSQQNFNNLGQIEQGRGAEAYQYGTGIRDYVTNKYKAMLEGMGAPGAGGGGGGGGGDKELQGLKGDWQTIRRLGATSADQLNRLRGFGVPEEFARTGGYSDQDRTNFRLQSTESVPGFWDAARRNLASRAAVTGGYGPGFDAGNLALMREQSRGAASAALGAENTLQENIRGNRKWGAEQGAGNERFIFGNQTEALKKLETMRNAAIARGNAAAARSFSEQMAILGQLRDLRGETGAEVDYDKLAMSGYGGGLQSGQSYAQANPNVSIWDRVAQLGGAAAGVMGAFGAMGGGKKKPTSSYV